ncbi:unnamed protein product [Cladocopium goreaui]|uniref:B30.2/SPRY domain-containing protein n=1 Tax=Cladocopium goreaui TaxID=2562237 RepID=A0A9P1CFY9_9DINO|nr:unnamed protein product [Cladocopium goreaui]
MADFGRLLMTAMVPRAVRCDPPPEVESRRTNSLLLEARPVPSSQASAQRLPEMEELWPDLPPRRCSMRQNWRRSASLCRVGAELVSEREVEVGVHDDGHQDTSEMSFAPPFEMKPAKLRSERLPLEESGQSTGSLTNDKTCSFHEPKLGDSEDRQWLQAKEESEPPASHASPVSRYREATPFAARSVTRPTPARAQRTPLSEEDALAIVRDWASKQIPELMAAAERRSLLKNFPTAKKIAVVLFGKPDEDFRDWVKQRTRSDYEAAKEQLERRRSSAEAAGEEPPVDDLKEPPEADFPSKMEVSDKVLAHELKNFSLPDKAEGFDEIRYEWADEASPGEMETEISVVKRKTPVALQLMNK